MTPSLILVSALLGSAPQTPPIPNTPKPNAKIAEAPIPNAPKAASEPAAPEEEPVIYFRVKTKHARGPVRCGLYDLEKHWLSSRFIAKDTAPVKGRVAVCAFRDLPPGRYAISAYHDANDDGALDRNFIGIPTEDYAFSSGAKAVLSPPSFDDADFSYRGGTLKLRGSM